MLAIVLHQTDNDGNWAGGNRPSKDRTWNIDLTNSTFPYESLSRSPLQLTQYRDGSFNIHRCRGYDNYFSPEETEYISQFIPAGAHCRSISIYLL